MVLIRCAEATNCLTDVMMTELTQTLRDASIPVALE